MPDSFSLKLYAAGDIGSGKQGQLFEMIAKNERLITRPRTLVNPRPRTPASRLIENLQPRASLWRKNLDGRHA